MPQSVRTRLNSRMDESTYCGAKPLAARPASTTFMRAFEGPSEVRQQHADSGVPEISPLGCFSMPCGEERGCEFLALLLG
jgi:hypothetical protein